MNTYTHPALESEITDQAAIYCGTYHKYNSGSIAGKWIDLTLVADKQEFYEICAAIHADEQDPEFMFQDYQSIPEGLEHTVGESGINDEFFDKIETALKLQGMDESEWVSLNNIYSLSNRSENEIYNFDDEFFSMFFSNSPMEAARAASFGHLNWSDDYIRFNGSGNLESTDRPSDWIDKKEVAKHVLDNQHLYSL